MSGDSPSGVICDIKKHLMNDYEAATNEFSRTVSLLSRRMGVLPLADYTAIRAASERARQRSDDARVSLDEHIREHGC